jgi:hypothetical protein
MMNDIGSDGPAELAPFSDRSHKVTPVPGSVVKTKPGFRGAPADLMDPQHYPVEAIDVECGEIVHSEHIRAGWTHTGRRPGEPR